MWYAKKLCGVKFVKCHTRDGRIKAELKTDPDAPEWITISTLDDFHKHSLDVNIDLVNNGLRKIHVLKVTEIPKLSDLLFIKIDSAGNSKITMVS